MEKISVFGVKNDIFLSTSDIYATKPKFDLRALFPDRLAVSFTSVIILLTSSIFTVGASQSSLPGETLYPVKRVTEQVALAVASEQDKPKIEIEQAGKRLEELAQISQKASDSNQHQKVEQLVTEFQQKVDSANAHLAQLNEKGKSDSSVKVASVARVVNEQSEKYTEVLQKTTDNLPEAVKEKVADKLIDAAATTQKTNLTSLMVMVESTDEQNKDEVAAKVQKTVEQAEVKVNELSVQTATAAAAEPNCATPATDAKPETTTPAAESTVCPASQAQENVVITEEAKKKLEEAKENLKNDNLTDTLKSVSAVTQITAQVTSPTATAAPAATETAVPAATTTQTAPQS